MNEDFIDLTYYWSIIYKLIQLDHSWLDISYFIGIVNHFMMKPQRPHLTTTKIILIYIVRTLDYKIFYHINSPTILLGFVDTN